MTTLATPERLSERELDALVRDHLALVGHLVREMLGRVPAHVNRDDLTSAGLAALAAAAKSYDPSRGTPFGSFATVRIRGALLDELRGLDWASRSVRHRARKIETATAELTAQLGRTPTEAELAETLGVAVSELHSAADDVQRAVVLSLQGFAAGTAEDLVPDRTQGPEELLLHREKIGYLHQAISALPERLRTVVESYFLDERPMAVIAAELGVTESRVSQLRAEALTLLRDGINSQLDPDQLPTHVRQDGCIARRRHTYYTDVAARGNLHSRLTHTSPLGTPLRGALKAAGF
ncbi:sigma-70 family RNA polymerase sigma factor [Cryptosporangium phraense]|uniref:Sigma-70 family RNA polymerase sigma factor n=1 Tax=Cryptosporangium phraense TaxID=2593070 RepID=A0A545AZN5_9ACTN|nr:sigma-70 family RNA polymerase sigma factor [Cryptosporangium phraense]TQS46787.1 sigma-70 family RNA polymerase sigma factor [Cryptosporangium phraense]